MNPLAVRPAARADAARVAEIYVESWNRGFGELMPPQVLDDDRIERWGAELTSERTRWWVATDTDAVIGFAGIGPSRDPIDSTLGELDTIAVAPSHWRQGAGSALMRAALDALTTAGYAQAIVWTLAGYEQGQRFYKSFGWFRDGGSRDYGHQVSFRHPLG